MKKNLPRTVAMVIVAIVAVAGLGIVQAGATSSGDRVLGFEDQEFVQAINAPEPDLDHQPVPGEYSLANDYAMSMESPLETGALPQEDRVEHRVTGFEDGEFIQVINNVEEDLDHNPPIDTNHAR